MAKRRVTVENVTREQADAITLALEDPVTRASVIIVGILKTLPSDRARTRVLQWATDKMQDDEKAAALAV